MEEEDKGRKGVVLKVNEEEQASSSNNEDENDEDKDMALVIRIFKKFYKKGFNKRGKKLHSRKEDKVPHSSRLEKKKSKCLIGARDQDSSESEGEEKANMCFMALESEVQSSPSNFSNFIDDDGDNPNSMLIEICDELKKISKRNKELKNKIDNLLNENSKLVCENKTLLESLEVLKKEKDFSNMEFQKLVIENKNLCEKVLFLEKCMVDYNDLKKKVSDLTMCIVKFTNGKNFEILFGAQRSPFDKNGIGYNHSNTFSN
ncbi:hypothetical protein M9H77_29580 [Catharanthus roseus]|uniref:Uncharacterized protein n=1 Tax=Catharanthus roseus TaxID=4058 RepID=A0ACB9ZUV4_CATRO|nr:hypothetical protein M9H77_29580 [Catharanthus roseus]